MQEDNLVNTEPVTTRRRTPFASAPQDDEPMDTVTADSASLQQAHQQQPETQLPLMLPQPPKHNHCPCHQSVMNISNTAASNAPHGIQSQRAACDAPTIPRRRSSHSHQQQNSRNRSSAISAKSKTCYLSQYKGTKSAYFNSVLVTGRLPASAAATVARTRLPSATATAASCTLSDA